MSERLEKILGWIPSSITSEALLLTALSSFVACGGNNRQSDALRVTPPNTSIDGIANPNVYPILGSDGAIIGLHIPNLSILSLTEPDGHAYITLGQIRYLITSVDSLNTNSHLMLTAVLDYDEKGNPIFGSPQPAGKIFREYAESLPQFSSLR